MSFPFVGTHTRAEWEAWGGQNHAVVEDAVTLATAARRQYVTPASLVRAPPLPFAVVDLDVDDCGDVWLLTGEGALHRYDPGRDELRRIHCTWEDSPVDPRAIAVTRDTVFVAVGPGGAGGASPTEEGGATPTGGRIHAFSRHLLQTRWVADAYAEPTALARRGDTVSVLDAGGDGGEPFVATVGRGGDPEGRATGFRGPLNLAVDEAGDRFVLDRDPDSGETTVERVPAGGASVETAVPSSQFVVTGSERAIAPESLGSGLPGEFVVGDANAETSEPSLYRYARATGSFDRLPAYTGAVAGLLLRRGDVDGADALYVVGEAGRALSTLPATERTRVNPDTGRYDGQVVRRLDAGERGTQWHRLTLSLSTPGPGTQVRAFYHATDEATLDFEEPGTGSVIPLEDVDGIGPVIAGRLRDAHVRGLRELVRLAPERVADVASHGGYAVSADRAAGWIAEARDVVAADPGAGDLEWQSVGPPDPEDALLTDAEGRYLWVKLELVGTPVAAPRVESLRAYFPRQSYLRYLPAVYQQDADGAAFLEAYLSLFESVFTGIEAEISAATRYLDPDGVPGEALSWLAGWLALAPDETWSTASKRTLVRRAHELFKMRGTRAGLREVLTIYLADRAERPPEWRWAIDRQREAIDERVAAVDARETAGELSPAAAGRLRESLCAQRDRLDRTLFVWEQSDLACIDDREVRETYERLLPCPQCFAVLLWPSLAESTVREAQRLVETTRPAHAVGRAVRLRPWIQLAGNEADRGHHTYLGVNSALADRDFVVDSSGLGADTRLTEHEPHGQVGVTGRLGIDTDLS